MAEQKEEVVQRWTAKRRASLVLSILKGETSVQEAAPEHGLRVAEVEDWKERFVSACGAVRRWIEWYNEQRPHQALDYKSPREFPWWKSPKSGLTFGEHYSLNAKVEQLASSLSDQIQTTTCYSTAASSAS